MNDEEIRTYPVALEVEQNEITMSIPWAQRQPNGAVIARVHVRSPKYSAGELLLAESDLVALDPDERPLRTQVRRVWGYGSLAELTPEHLQTARFDVGFRIDLAATRGGCGLSVAIVRTFRPGAGPKAVGGPWVFRLRVADEQEIAAAVRADAARQEALRQESARQEAARQEALRLEMERREAARLERLRVEAMRVERPVQQRPERLVQAPVDVAAENERYVRAERAENASGGQLDTRSRRPPRFVRPERVLRQERPLQVDQLPTSAGEGTATAAAAAKLPDLAPAEPPQSEQPPLVETPTAHDSLTAGPAEPAGEGPATVNPPVRARATPRTRTSRTSSRRPAATADSAEVGAVVAPKEPEPMEPSV